jgi:hypothetical protein
MVMANEIDVYFNAMGPKGRTLAVVAVGTDVYGATDVEPIDALRAVATKAADDLAVRGRLVHPDLIVERGRDQLKEFEVRMARGVWATEALRSQ